MNCKGRLILLSIAFVLLAGETAFSQTTKTRKITETIGMVTMRYHVVKAESLATPPVRHGNYIEEVEVNGQTFVLAQGAFVDGKEAGQWMSYHYGTEQLASSGWYVSGKRSGEWQFYYPDGSVKRIGAFKGGKETGNWQTFYPGANAPESRKLFCKGNYANGRKEGNWAFYGPDGLLLEQIDFSSGKLLSSSTFANELARQHLLFSLDSSHQVVAENLSFEYLDSPPVFPGGKVNLYKSLFPDLTYPGQTTTDRKMVVRATVNEDGTSVDYRIETGLNPKTDLEVLNRLNRLEDHWKPGIFEGEPVSVVVFIPLGFTGTLPEARYSAESRSKR